MFIIMSGAYLLTASVQQPGGAQEVTAAGPLREALVVDRHQRQLRRSFRGRVPIPAGGTVHPGCPLAWVFAAKPDFVRCSLVRLGI